MKRLSVASARSIWLFPVDDLNPIGIDLIPIWNGIKNRYQFQRFPTKIEEMSPVHGGVEFGNGAFRLENGLTIEIVTLKVFGDGILVETRSSTSMSDAVIQDVLLFASKLLRSGFDVKMVRRKAYSVSVR